MAGLWEDNLSYEITFLYLGVSSMSRYVNLSIIVLICLYKRMDINNISLYTKVPQELFVPICH